MKAKIISFYLALTMLVFIACEKKVQSTVQPLINAHAHNDYYHDRPLYDAVENGFISVEVDVLLHNDTVFVGHDSSEIKRENTLRRLYLDPIKNLCVERGGWIVS